MVRMHDQVASHRLVARVMNKNDNNLYQYMRRYPRLRALYHSLHARDVRRQRGKSKHPLHPV